MSNDTENWWSAPQSIQDFNAGTNNGGLGALPYSTKKIGNKSFANIDGYDYEFGTKDFSDAIDVQKLNQIALTNKANSDWATGANSIQWKDVKGVGDFGSWLTSNRGGGSNYLDYGMKGLQTAATLYSAYNDNKYKKKMANIAQQAQDLQAKQQALYEKQVARQDAKSDAAQKAYDDAQKMTV